VARKSRLARPTMIDVARAAGVSQSCVSLVLNDPPGARLSEATRQHVLSTAKTLGYKLPQRRPRKTATPVRAGRRVIAYVVDEMSLSPHPVLHVDGARDAAWATDCLLQVHVTRGDQTIEAETLSAIENEPAIAGVIYATHFTRQVEPPKLKRTLPAVLLNCYTVERVYPTLLPGEVAGGFAATQHLIARGHRRIAHIGGEAWMDAARDRERGYRDALATADIAPDPELVREGDWTSASGYAHTMALLQLRTPPTAIFCANDLMAMGAMEAARDLGRAVPADVSIVGYNDIELSRHLRPPLTTLRVPNYDLGRRAVELLVDAALLDRPHRATITKLECPLIERGTVAELP
jgi:LacI family transcriptional regulator